MARTLIILGAVLLALAWPWLARPGLGRLPDGSGIARDSFRLYFPVATSVLVSRVLTLLLMSRK